MITAGTHPPISIDLGSNEPGMTALICQLYVVRAYGTT